MHDELSPLRGLRYVILGVADIERSLPFYRDLLGLTVTHRIEQPGHGWAFLDAGGMTVCLSEMHAARADHIAGAVEVVFSVAAIDAAYERLQARGVVFHQAPHRATEHEWAANFRDPDGHELSIFGPPGSHGAE